LLCKCKCCDIFFKKNKKICFDYQQQHQNKNL
jgi:hypothetical protein